jgi:hypothetical protein
VGADNGEQGFATLSKSDNSSSVFRHGVTRFEVILRAFVEVRHDA